MATTMEDYQHVNAHWNPFRSRRTILGLILLSALTLVTMMSTRFFVVELTSDTEEHPNGQRTVSITPPVSQSCLSDSSKAPIPVVLLTKGRSGSKSTWQVMGDLAGGTSESDEYAGSSVSTSKEFFQEHVTGDWLMDILCQKQRDNKKVGVVGIKWKPYLDSFRSTGSVEALQLIRDHPEIKLVRSRRNPLDVLISVHKHELGRQVSDPSSSRKGKRYVNAHCKVGNVKCQERHFAVSTGMILPVKRLLKNLRKMSESEDEVDRMLQEMGVPHIEVSYERLYHSDSAAEWMRIMKFLGRGPTKKLTMEDVRATMVLAATSHPSHNVTLGNYEEVRQVLAGSAFESLLRT